MYPPFLVVDKLIKLMTKIANKLKYLLLIIFAVYFIGTALLLHSHVISNKIVIHSHPYANSPENHTHTKNEISIIAQMSIIISFVSFAFFALNRSYVLAISKQFYENCLLIISSNSTRQLRAPPVL